MGRTPDFSVRGTTGPAGAEGEGRATSFELPSPSLSSKKAPSVVVFADVIALMHARACILSNGVLLGRH